MSTLVAAISFEGTSLILVIQIELQGVFLRYFCPAFRAVPISILELFVDAVLAEDVSAP